MHLPIERLPARRSGFRVICAWCGLTLLEGDGETSHGLCDACADGLTRSFDAIKRRPARAAAPNALGAEY